MRRKKVQENSTQASEKNTMFNDHVSDGVVDGVDIVHELDIHAVPKTTFVKTSPSIPIKPAKKLEWSTNKDRPLVTEISTPTTPSPSSELKSFYEKCGEDIRNENVCFCERYKHRSESRTASSAALAAIERSLGVNDMIRKQQQQFKTVAVVEPFKSGEKGFILTPAAFQRKRTMSPPPPPQSSPEQTDFNGYSPRRPCSLPIKTYRIPHTDSTAMTTTPPPMPATPKKNNK